MEESLVLYCSKARVMKEPAVHKVSLLKEVVLVLLRGILSREFSVIEIIRVFHDFNRIITSLRV